MIEARCIEKYRDNSNNIISYLLQSEDGSTRVVPPYELKYLMNTNEIHVQNLKITSDDRIIDDNSYKTQPNVKDRVNKLASRLSHDAGIKFNNKIKVTKCNDKDFIIELSTIGNTALKSIGLKSNRNIIKITFVQRDLKGQLVSVHKHLKFDQSGYESLVNIARKAV